MNNPPKKKGAAPALSVVLPENIKNLLDEVASRRQTENYLKSGDTRKVYKSDIAREAIEQYLIGLGYEVDVDVDRGGWRERKED